ncbi:MAG: L,D-transpeptidase [Pseudolabrys sp.]|nr:L,D-transpeptidase [Pseudolabrys sp.]
MIRPLGSLLLTLPVMTALAVGTAQAQSAKDSQPGALHSLMGLFQSQAKAQPLGRGEIQSEGLPPPGFATPDGGPPPVGDRMMGQQFGNQPQAAPAPVLNGNYQDMRPPGDVGSAPPPVDATSVMSLPPDDQPELGQPKELPPNLKKQLVDYTTKEPAGTILVDTANTYLYLVLGGGKALRYGVRVGREGFTWTGTERVSKMKEWPDWHPPAEMIERQPYLPRFMAGGNGNPLGARALYLGSTLYRIHGTNQPSTIGHYVSSGCVGMLNEDIEDLYSRVQVGTRVVVLPGKAPSPDTVAHAGPPAPANPMAPPSAQGGPQYAGPHNAAPSMNPTAINPPVMNSPAVPPTGALPPIR